MTELGFDERFAMLVDAEYLARENRRLARLLKDAQLRLNDACVEDIEASQSRGLDKPMLRQLANCSWLREHLNVLIVGPTGVGKSFVACALGQAVCRAGYRVLYRRVPASSTSSLSRAPTAATLASSRSSRALSFCS